MFISLVAILACVLILVLALNSYVELVFPTYSYSEYVDRSEDSEFSSDAGAQLYEAESLDLYGSATAEENVRASGGNVADNLYTGSYVELFFYSDADIEVQFYISTSYISQTNRQSICSNLFTLEVNDEEVTSSEYIQPSYNEYDFIETYIANITLVKGYNSIDVISKVNSYTIDYILLVSPEEKATEFESIGYNPEPFVSSESRQTYFAFRQREIEGAAFIYDEDTESYCVFFSNPDDSINFYIDSDADTETSISVSAKKMSSASATPGVSITVNGESVGSSSFTNMTEEYSELNLGTVTLIKGLNTISITNLGGYFYLQSIVLNEDVNLSPTLSNQRFEAENAEINGCSITSTYYGSGQKVVGSNLTGSFVKFNFVLNQDCDLYLSVRLSYAGSSAKALSEIISMTVNGTSYDVPDTEVEPTDYNNYLDLYIGKISLAKGTPVIRITSVSGGYNLDCITFFNTEYSKGDEVTSEAEDLILLDGVRRVYSTHASGEWYVSNTVEYSSQSLFFYCEEAADLTLTAALSYTTTTSVTASAAFDVMINMESISYDAPVISNTGVMYEFNEVNLGTFSFSEGMNVLRFTNYGYIYGMDYIVLSA